MRLQVECAILQLLHYHCSHVCFFQLICEYLDSKNVSVVSQHCSWHKPDKERISE